jgi:hypothetical protein
MSFPRYQEIYPSDGNAGIAAGVPAHRLDEFPVGYSSASCTPALLASASPTGSDYAVMSSYWSTVFQRPATSVLTGCLTPGGKRNVGYWFFGRPTTEELRQDLRAVLKKCRPDWDITSPEMKAAWERGEKDRFYPYGKTYAKVFGEQE